MFMKGYRKICTQFIIAGLSTFFTHFNAEGQVQHSGWLASFNTIGIHKNWSIHFDAQLRTTDALEQVQTVLLRPGLNYHFNKQLSVTSGYAFIGNRRTVSNIAELLPEHRIWQQAIYAHKLEKIAVAHRLRFEERFISKAKVANNALETDGYSQAYRLRYFIRTITPLTKDAVFSKGVFFAMQDEVFLNTGNKHAVNGKTFDQNRLYLAFGYRLPGKIDLEAGYMNQYTKTRAAFINNHIGQLALYKRL
jgi:hypothetical protein